MTLLVLSPTGVPGITLLIYKADDGTRSVYLTDLLYYTWVKNLFSAYGRPIAGKSQHFKLHSPVLSTCYNHFIPIIAGMYITGFWTHYLLSNASVMGKTLLTNITRELAPEMRNSLP